MHSVMLSLAITYQIVLAGSVDKRPVWKSCLGCEQNASGEQETWGHIFPVTKGLLNELSEGRETAWLLLLKEVRGCILDWQEC